MYLNEIPLWFLRAFGFGFGLLWGSFLNVVIYRVPREMSVSRPPSHCPACKAPVKPWDNIPVLSYVILRGRARCCGAKMSPRYVLVELIGGFVSLAIVEALVRPLPSNTTLAQLAAVYFSYFFVCMALVAAAFIDLEHMYIPDMINYVGALLGIITATVRGYSIKEAAIGAVLGFVIVWLPLNVIYRLIRGRTGMGLGDAKLLMLIGAWTGWQGTLFALFGGAICATLFALGLRIAGKELEVPQAVKEELEELRKAAAEGDAEAKELLDEDPLAENTGEGFMGRRLPFGPFLILCFFAYVFGMSGYVRDLLSIPGAGEI
ncbi:MAG: prepilin peptidase [Polyangiaceae bacterium]|nr:prepilin peptidase [Polyangiaceae bacterium]